MRRVGLLQLVLRPVCDNTLSFIETNTNQELMHFYRIMNRIPVRNLKTKSLMQHKG